MIIETLIAPILRERGAEEVLDDCAVLDIGNDQVLVVSIDQGPTMPFILKVGGDYEDLGHFHVTMNVSDIASMGAVPSGMVMVLEMESDFAVRDLEKLLNGIRIASNQYGVPLLGGDTKETKKTAVTIAIFGIARKGHILTRYGARPGDLVCISGTVGTILSDYVNKYRQSSKEPKNFRRPTARLDLGVALLKEGICTSCMDMSDGLFSSLIQLAETNDSVFEVDLDKCPMRYPSHLRESNSDWMEFILNVGGDFELLFTLRDSPSSYKFVEDHRCSILGKVLQLESESDHLSVVGAGSQDIKVAPWEHFKTIDQTIYKLEAFLC